MKYNAVLDIKFSEEDTTEPVTLAEAKEWCKIELDITEEDALITELIKSARTQCESFLCISLINRTVSAFLNNSLGSIEFPYGPVVAITAITDCDGITLTSDYYKLRGLFFKNLQQPCDDNLTAVYTAGYEDGIPENFKTALLNQILYSYENRGDQSERTDNLRRVPQLSPQSLIQLNPHRRVC